VHLAEPLIFCSFFPPLLREPVIAAFGPEKAQISQRFSSWIVKAELLTTVNSFALCSIREVSQGVPYIIFFFVIFLFVFSSLAGETAGWIT
jgi:hypothetical protein